MTQWGVFGVLTTVITFGITVVRPIVNLTKSITKLAVVVEQLKQDYREQHRDNEEDHKRMWNTIMDHTTKLCIHDTRLQVLEMEDDA